MPSWCKEKEHSDPQKIIFIADHRRKRYTCIKEGTLTFVLQIEYAIYNANVEV